MGLITDFFRQQSSKIEKKNKLRKLSSLEKLQKAKFEERKTLLYDLLGEDISTELATLKAIKNYIEIKNTHVLTIQELENEANLDELIQLIEKYFTVILKNLPEGALVPIPTNFEIDGCQQTLFLGRNITTVGKFLNFNSNKLNHTFVSIDRLAFLMNYDKAMNLDLQKNNRVLMEDPKTDSIVNLINNELLETPCLNCRFANIDLKFNSVEESSNYIKFINETSMTTSLIKYLPKLDKLIHYQIIEHFNDLSESMQHVSNSNTDIEFENGLKLLKESKEK